MAQYEHTPGDSAHPRKAVQHCRAAVQVETVCRNLLLRQSADLCVLFASQAHVDCSPLPAWLTIEQVEGWRCMDNDLHR